MERKTFKGKKFVIGYHTQECREEILESPILCNVANAWLGTGFYFWTDIEFAHCWGKDYKMSTGSYDIYRAYLDTEKAIDAVFNEEGYKFYTNCIEAAINDFKEKKKKFTLVQINRFVSEKFWTKMGITGIIFDDKPTNKTRTHSEIAPVYYKKRIQICMFKLENISNFEMFLEEQA